MNNFDDLFEQQPQNETVPRKPEPQAEKPKKKPTLPWTGYSGRFPRGAAI